MELSTPKFKKLEKVQKKSKQTPIKEKPKPKRFKKHHSKANSMVTFRDLDFGFNDIKKSRKFYIDLKETQLMNLYSAIKIKIVILKRRYEAIVNNALLFQSKQRMVPETVLVMPSPKSLRNISPITNSESQCGNSSFTNFFDFKTQRGHNAELYKKLESIEKESEKIFEEKLKVDARIKGIAKCKSEFIIGIANLYQKKKLLAIECGKLIRLTEENKQKKLAIKKLEEHLHKIKDNISKLCFKTYETKEIKTSISQLLGSVANKKVKNTEIERKLAEIEASNAEKEQYLKEIADLKQKIVDRSEKMKEFDHYLSYTKQTTTNSLIARKNSLNF